MSLKIFEKTDLERWNQLVDSAAGGSVFHHWEWLEIAAKHTGSVLYPLAYLDDGGHPFGLFPLFYLKRGLFKAVFSPPPRCAMRLGPVIVNSDMKQHKLERLHREFQAQVDDFIARLRPHYVSVITNTGFKDARPFVWGKYKVTPSYTYKIDLTQGKEQIWDSFKAELRKVIKSTEKRGVSVVNASSGEDIDYLYESLCDRYQTKNRALPIPREYLSDLFQQIGSSHLRLFIALFEGKRVGAICHLVYKDTISVWVGAAKSNVEGLAVNDLIQWKAIEWSLEHEFGVYEIMGAGTPSICEFKARYSPSLELYFTAKKANLLGAFAEKLYLARKRGAE